MNDKDFKFDFYIGGSENDPQNSNPSNEPPQEAYSEILLNSFSEGELYCEQEKPSVWGRFKKWWKDRKKWQKATIIASLAVLLVFSIIASVFYLGIGYNYNKITADHEDLGIENIIDKDIVNVALFGIDTRSLESFKGNSDSIMILSLNTKTKKVKIISLMRDTFIPITYNGITTYNKINSAYAKGGPELAIKVINSNFGLDITDYATVNFFGMVDIIDAVGGIEAELTKAEVVSSSVNSYALNGTIAEICTSLNVSAKENFITTPGKQHLNGIQAVAYSRIRYVANVWGTNNDYGRTDRQRYVMEQLFNKALTLEKSQYMKLAKSLIPCTQTSLSYKEIIGLAFNMLLESPSFEQARIPRDDMTMRAPKTSAGSVVYYDLAFAKKLIHSFIYDDISFDQYIEENGIQKNDWYAETISNRKPATNNSSKPSKDNGNASSPKDTVTSDSSGRTDSSGDSSSELDENNSSGNSDSNDGPSDDASNSSDKDKTSNNEPTDNNGESDAASNDGSSNSSGSSDDNSSNEEDSNSGDDQNSSDNTADSSNSGDTSSDNTSSSDANSSNSSGNSSNSSQSQSSSGSSNGAS